MKEDVLKILSRFQEDPESITPEELSTIVKFTADNAETPSSDSETSEILEAVKEFSSSSTARAAAAELALQAEKGELSQDLVAAFSTTLGLIDFGIAQSQIANFKSAEAALEEPTLRQGFEPSQALARAIERVESRIESAARDPREELARGDIADAFNADVNAARTISEGQAGAVGALQQGAVNRRRRSALELQALRQGLVRQDEQILSGLLRNRVEEERTGEIAQSNIDRIRFNQFNLKSEAAGKLGAQGGFNKRVALGRLSGALANALPRTIGRNRSINAVDEFSPINNSAAARGTVGISPIPNQLPLRNPTQIRNFNGQNGANSFLDQEFDINQSLTQPF